jgi:hypothetical protein
MAEITSTSMLDPLEVYLHPFRGGANNANQLALGLLDATGQAGAKWHVSGSHLSLVPPWLTVIFCGL